MTEVVVNGTKYYLLGHISTPDFYRQSKASPEKCAAAALYVKDRYVRVEGDRWLIFASDGNPPLTFKEALNVCQVHKWKGTPNDIKPKGFFVGVQPWTIQTVGTPTAASAPLQEVDGTQLSPSQVDARLRQRLNDNLRRVFGG